MAGLMQLAIAALLSGLATASVAQTWTGVASGQGATRFGTVHAPQYTLALRCNTPPADGGSRHIDGNNAFPVNAPFALTVEISDQLIPGADGNAMLSAVSIWVDGTGYRLPPVAGNAVYGVWQVDLQMADALVQALYSAQTLVLDSGLGQAWQFPTDGLEAALDTALAACVEGWTAWGQTIPVALNRYWPAVGEDVTATAPAPASAPPAALPPSVDAHVRSGCGAPYRLDPAPLGRADFDGDGQPDLILDWRQVTCMGPLARPFCGAANCSIDIFLSSRPGAPSSRFLGIGYTVVPQADGGQGIRFGGTAGACAAGECDIIYRWNGSRFAP